MRYFLAIADYLLSIFINSATNLYNNTKECVVIIIFKALKIFKTFTVSIKMSLST